MSIKGITVKRVLVEQGIRMEREIYAGIVVDRVRKCPVLMVSAAGGVDIEEVAATSPERILQIPIRPGLRLRDFQIRRATYFLELPEPTQKTFAKTLRALEAAMMDHDASLVEINPLAITDKDEIIACDAKMNFDDNALPVHAAIERLRDENEEDPQESEAPPVWAQLRQAGWADRLPGQRRGGWPWPRWTWCNSSAASPPTSWISAAGATPDRIAEALRIVSSDTSVNTILFNIFGGIVRCRPRG